MNAPETVPPESSASRCPRCQAALPADAPAGLCPACLVSAHFGTAADATEPAAAAPAPAVDEIAPHFPQLEILACLGRGGMGVVYRARQKSLGRLVALKLLAPERGADPAFAERFAREAQALARLDHPHIVTIHDFGQAGGYFYLLMEYVDGVTLRQLVQGGRIAAREALAIVPQICDALQFAHDHGVVHRDIKPENILLDRRGQVKVADFGLAKLVGPAEDRSDVANGAEGGEGLSPDITAAGHVMGTPRYMAPEQRERPTEVAHRADIYALGVVLYQMLTGELPGGKQLDPPSRRVRVDVRLDEIVLRALERDPERRYASATEFTTRIETFAAEAAPAGTAAEAAKGEASQTSAPSSPPHPVAAAGTTDANATQADAERRAAIEKLKPAATALIVSSALNLAGLVFGLILGVGMTLLLSVATVHAVGAQNLVSPTLMFLVAPLGVAGALTWLIAVVAVLWVGLHAAANIFIITSARRMMNGRSQSRARAAAIVAVVLGFFGMLTAAGQGAIWFFGLWSLLQLAAGVWALVLLQKSETRAAFEAPSEPEQPRPAATATQTRTPAAGSAPATDAEKTSDRAEPDPNMIKAGRRVAVPATGLLVAATAQLLIIGLAFVVMVARFINGLAMMSFAGPALIFLVGALSLFVLLCAMRMRRLRGYGLAVCAAVLAIMSFQGVILGPIFGIWALVVLLRRDVRSAFAGETTMEPGVAKSGGNSVEAASRADAALASPEEASRRVATPSTGLLVSAGLQLLAGIAALVFFVFFVRYHDYGNTGTLEMGRLGGGWGFRNSTTPAFGPPKWYLFAPALLAGGLLFPAVTFFGALRMRRLRSHGLAVCGAVLAILTLQGAGLGVIFGVWALVVLWRRDVHQAFDAGQAGGRGRGCIFAAAVLLLVGILAAAGAAAMFAVFKSTTVIRDFGSMPGMQPVVPTITPPSPPMAAPPIPTLVANDFGAVQTWTLPFGENDETPLLDLEAARIALPAGEAAAAFEKRLSVAGVYFHHNRATGELKFSGLSVGVMNLDFKGDGVWDGFNSAPLRKSVGDMVGTPGTRSSTSLRDPDSGMRTHVYLFKTLTGACGLLRTMTLTRDPHEISIEWKFFSDAGPVMKVTTAAAERPLTTEQLEANKPALAEADTAALRDLREDLGKRLAEDFEANHGAPGPNHAYLSLWIARVGAELARRPTATKTPIPPTTAAGAMSVQPDRAATRSDLESRMRAIATISQWQTRDDSLSTLALDAAKAGEVSVARNALGAMSNWQARDGASRRAALALKAAGRREDALAIAQTISAWQIKDQTVAEISR